MLSKPSTTEMRGQIGFVPEEARPPDWPGPGPIDLAVHDLPHESSTTEWWYLNAHLRAVDGREFSMFASFFRQLKGRNRETGDREYAHSVTWGIHDVARQKFIHRCRIDQSAPEEGLKRLQRGLGSKDERLNRALREMLERGRIPKPDQVFSHRVFINRQRCELDYSGDVFRKLDDGSYRLHFYDQELGAGCDVVFDPRKAPVRHGDNGVVRGSGNERMFYYFIPRCEVRGTLTCNGEKLRLADGQGWYDHEFGVGTDYDIDDEAEAQMPEEERLQVQGARRLRMEAEAIGWDWLSAQLDDGTDITVYPMQYLLTKQSAGDHAIIVDHDGARHTYNGMKFEPQRWWQSSQTFFDYPTCWKLTIPDAGVDLDVEAEFADQEFITLISKPSFWEGRVRVRGTVRGREVGGLGFVERCGFTPFEDLDGFFEVVGRRVRRSVDEVLPEHPDYGMARKLIGNEERDQYMKGLDVEQYARTHIAPIREITNRGGKGWRSYAALTCCDIVGGDSRKFVRWLALPEMMHVGSLIVDDVEDKSTVRRGGPTAHMVHGEAQAINSGTAAYFICHELLDSALLSDADKLRLYGLYFEALRAGHAGQAIDLDGFDDLLPTVVDNGDGNLLEDRVLCVHRLKTAAPAGCLARMGAIGGGGTDAQVEGLGAFFEDLGLAFQIIDDVLNLRGFRGDLKTQGEDIQQGKITLPVAKAMSRLEHAERRKLWEILRSKPSDPEVVRGVIDMLESCGAIEDCVTQARGLVEDGWRRLDPLVEDSLAKMLLRSFGWYILERHY